jgi:uncharacterized phage infection (PIP) family protein YhgE
MGTDKKKEFKPKGGRPEITDGTGLTYRVNWKLNKDDKEKLNKAFKNSGIKTMSEFLRLRLIETKDVYVHDPKEIIKTLDLLGEEVGRIGNNINQLAKYANILILKEKLEPSVIDELNVLLREYSSERKEIVLAMRSLFKKRG